MKLTEQNENILNAVLGGLTSDNVLKAMKSQIPQASKFKGEVTVRIPFELTKGKNGDAAPTASILSQAVLAKALVMSGIMVEPFMANLKRAAIEAMTAGDKVGEALSEEDQRVVEMIEKVKGEVISALPRQAKNGTVTVKGIPEIKAFKVSEIK